MVYLKYLIHQVIASRARWWGLAAAVVLAGAVLLSRPDGRLHVVFYDVGQGDAILIRTPRGKAVLVDGGPGDRILEKLGEDLPFYKRDLDLVVSTHPHADHISGLVEVINSYRIQKIVLNPFSYESGEYQAFLEVVEGEGAVVWPVKVGDVLALEEGVTATIIGPRRADCGSFEDNVNNCSIALVITFGEFDVLLTGDAEVEEQRVWDLTVDVEVLKAPHQGAWNGLYLPVLEQARPELVVVSVGKNNYGHPSPQVLGAYTEAGIEYLRTDEVGDIEVVSDGERWWAEGKMEN